MTDLSKNELVVYEEILLTCCCNFMDDLHVYEEEISITINEFEYKKKFNKNLSVANNEITWANVAPSYVDVDFSFEKSYLELNNTEVIYSINIK